MKGEGVSKMKRMKKRFSREDGNILLLFAATLTLLIFMVGIALDLGMIYMRRNDLIDLCQLARERRFTYQNTIRYAENPGRETYQIVSNAIRENGFDGNITVYFYEQEPTPAHRYYQVRTVLSEQYEYTFLKLFGADTVMISAYLDGGEHYGGEDSTDMIWHPKIPCSKYNGSYTGTNNSQNPWFAPGDLPSDWVENERGPL